MAQFISITSEALQATIRRLLPSQQGFGEDLQASNVITPIIDVTPTAEGTQLETSLAQALNFGCTEFNVTTSGGTDILNDTGFYRIVGTVTGKVVAGSNRIVQIAINDGSTTKDVYTVNILGGIADEILITPFDFNVFLRAQDKLQVYVGSGNAIAGSIRQIADVYGNATNPTGFTFE